MFHYAHLISAYDVAKHRDALPDAEFHVWPAGHGFNCDQRADYNSAVAAEALQHTLKFFETHLD